MQSNDAPEMLRPYLFHGVEINQDEPNASGDCPFCGRANKFKVATETGQFRCLYCDETGNAYSFMHRLHQLSYEGTSTKDYTSLAKSRGVTPASLRFFGRLAKSTLTGEWLAPEFNIKGNLSNLCRLVARNDEEGKQRFAFMGTPGCKPHPFCTDLFVQHPKPVVWITEGIWDGCALYDILSTTSKNGDRLIKTDVAEDALYAGQGILPVPGCGNFNADWLEALAGTELKVVFDNDHPKRYGPDHAKAGQLIIKGDETPTRPGWDGMERVAKLIEKSLHKPKSLHVMFWNGEEHGHNPKLKDGYDLGDLFKDKPGSKGLQFVLDHLQQVKLTAKKSRKQLKKDDAKPTPSVEPIETTTFEELCKHWSATLHFTQQLRDTLAIMLSVVLSTESEKVNHLWLRVIGPPGSGKSTLAEAISVAREWVAPKSLITGFHSGFVDPNAEEDESASLIPELDNKTVIMKDADTLVNSPGRDKILSELRDLYDGTSRAHYRTGQCDEFEDIRLSFILCGTDELRQLNRTFLGERFLDCEIMKRGEDISPYLQRASSNTWASLAGHLSPEKGDDEPISQDRMLYLKRVTYGFIKYLKENYKSFPIPKITDSTMLQIQAMGELVSMMRARVRHDHQEGSFKPRTELPTRLTSQFTKMAFFNSLVLQKSQVDADVLRLVLKVVHDTSIGTPFELCEQMANDGEDIGTSVRSMTLTTNLPETSVRRQLNDMRQFNIATPFTQSNNSGQRGRDRHLWVLTPNMRQLWSKVFSLTKGSTDDNRHSGSKRKRQDVGRKKTPKPAQVRRNPRSGRGSRSR